MAVALLELIGSLICRRACKEFRNIPLDQLSFILARYDNLHGPSAFFKLVNEDFGNGAPVRPKNPTAGREQIRGRTTGKREERAKREMMHAGIMGFGCLVARRMASVLAAQGEGKGWAYRLSLRKVSR